MSREYKIFLTEEAKSDLFSLDAFVARRITKKLRYFESVSNPLDYAEPLHTPFLGKYRFRIGEYRIIFVIEPSGAITVLSILSIKHRRNSYR